jgi:cytochrome c-type biogenesis protein CcmF
VRHVRPHDPRHVPHPIGCLDSVHAFSNSQIGPILLGFFAFIVAVTVGLIGWRGDRLRSPARIDSPLSREGAFLLNNVVFAAFAFVVLLGTVFPLIAETLSGDRVTVGVPYFERMGTPIGLVLLFLMAVAPVLPWRKTTLDTLRTRLIWPAWLGAFVLVVSLLVGARGFTPLLAFFLAGLRGRLRAAPARRSPHGARACGVSWVGPTAA